MSSCGACRLNWWKTLLIFLLISVAILGICFAVSRETLKRRVCIVGAGVSGLVSAKYFSEYPNEFEIVVFEKSSDVGGQWMYTDSTTVDEHGLPVHSSIYQSLRTNAVKAMMTFPDYPNFGGQESNGSYIKHEDVWEYLRNYTNHFNIRQYIKFSINVEKIRPLPNLRWQIVTQNMDTKTRSETTCDAVLVCNGHDVKGYMPKIGGIESFTGQVIHSHLYRNAKPFTGQTVVVLGASYSAVDISVDVSSLARKVYLSHRHDPLPNVFPPKLEQVLGVVGAKDDKLILSNSTKIYADALIFCTGYRYDFPFLDESSGIVVENGTYIHPIYKHVINIEYPTMALINMLQPSFHFRVPHAQANYFRAVLRGELHLPSREQMLNEAQLPANVPASKAHNLGYKPFYDYLNELVVAANGYSLPWWFASATDEIDKTIVDDPVHFRDKKMVIHENNQTVEFV